MATIKDYVVNWSYNDQHHCDFSGKIIFKDENPENVLEQFKKTDTWKEYGVHNHPDAWGITYFTYEIQEARELSDVVNESV